MFGFFTIRAMRTAFKSTSSLDELPEVFLSNAAISRKIGKKVRAGGARKLGPRLYTWNVSGNLEHVARRNWHRIAGGYFPGAVVVDRSAFEAKPCEDGSLFLDIGPDRARREAVRLPGLTLRTRSGPGPVAGDMPFMDGLYFAGPARKFLDNLRASRPRGGDVARTLSRAELEDKIGRMVSLNGKSALNELRDHARRVAPALGAEAELEILDELIGALLGTREAVLATAHARAQSEGKGFDPRRTELFSILQGFLLESGPLAARPEQPEGGNALPFIEAYFSNYIEGTEFTLDEASDIVFNGVVPEQRPADAHDILGTYELTNSDAEMRRTPKTGDEYVGMLRSRHAAIMAGRPDKGPGQFKDRANRAGNTEFVDPTMVEGTLRRGFDVGAGLISPFARATYLMFMTSEVHPFADGNGRTARIMMNAELAAASEVRIIIPTVYRLNYLAALKAATHGSNFAALLATLSFARRWTGRVDFTNRNTAEADLARTHALRDATEAEDAGIRLTMP